MYSCHNLREFYEIIAEKRKTTSVCFCQFQLMRKDDKIMEIPPQQKMERQQTLAREHSEEYKAALQRAVTLAVPHAYAISPYGTFSQTDEGEEEKSPASSGGSSRRRKETWDELIERLYDKDDSRHTVLKKSLSCI